VSKRPEISKYPDIGLGLTPI